MNWFNRDFRMAGYGQCSRPSVLHKGATVDVDRLARYPGCSLSAKVGDELANLIVRAVSAYGRGGGSLFPDLGGVKVRSRGRGGSRTYAVDVDIVGADLPGHVGSWRTAVGQVPALFAGRVTTVAMARKTATAFGCYKGFISSQHAKFS